jgi:hypothetical protein
VSIAYNPNRVSESEVYNIEYIEVGFFESSQWRALGRMEGFNYTQRFSVVLPLTLMEVTRKMKVAVKYQSCSSIVHSDPATVVQPAVCELIDSVVNSANFFFK